jgi:hypothetical protein
MAQWPPKQPEAGLVAVLGGALYEARDAFSGGVLDTRGVQLCVQLLNCALGNNRVSCRASRTLTRVRG